MASPRRDWFTAPEVAAQFRVTVHAVRLWILTGQLEGEQASTGARTWLIHDSAIDKFKKDRKRRNNGIVVIDPTKRYRVKSTGQVVTGAELLRRRNEEKTGDQQ